MSGIKRLRAAPLPPVKTPQCDAPFDPETWACPEVRKARFKKRGLDPNRCGKSSTYVIGGKHYCGSHAGMKALEILCTES